MFELILYLDLWHVHPRLTIRNLTTRNRGLNMSIS